MEKKLDSSAPAFFKGKFVSLTFIVLLVLGLGLRLYDLTDLPLDFHATRQLYSALKARGMYYETLPNIPEKQRDFAIQQWKARSTIEPEVLERLTAFTYHFTGEQLWVARLYSSLFWMIGGIFLFLLVRDLVSTDGALAALTFYLFLPYAVIASRSFQPDPLMVMLILGFWWSMARWGQKPTWGWTVLAGLLGGLAIFIKLVAVFFVIGGALGVALGRYNLKDLVRNPKVWALAGIGALPGALYVLYGVVSAGFLSRQFGGRFIPALLLEPLNYWRWVRQIEIVLGSVVPLVLGVLGLFFLERKPARSFAISLWISYFVFGLYFDYHIASHDYYSLILIPIVAISLAAPASWFLKKLSESARTIWPRLVIVGAMLFGLTVTMLDVRSQMSAVDYRPQAAFWTEISDLLDGQSAVALTQDYGLQMAFWGWRSAIHWPTSGDISYSLDVRGGNRDFDKQFQKLAVSKRFFLVTNLDDLDRQPTLKQRLFENYPIYAQGEGYLIFDLQNPIHHDGS